MTCQRPDYLSRSRNQCSLCNLPGLTPYMNGQAAWQDRQTLGAGHWALGAGLWAAGGTMQVSQLLNGRPPCCPDAEMQRTQAHISYQPGLLMEVGQGGGKVFLFFLTLGQWGPELCGLWTQRASYLDRWLRIFRWLGAGQPHSLGTLFTVLYFSLNPPGLPLVLGSAWPTEPSGHLEAASAPADSLVGAMTPLFI